MLQLAEIDFGNSPPPYRATTGPPPEKVSAAPTAIGGGGNKAVWLNCRASSVTPTSLPQPASAVQPRIEPGDIAAELLAVFTLRCEVRAKLWQLGRLHLHEAVDKLQADAERDGLVEQLGQDAVQAIMAGAFSAMREAEPEIDVPIENIDSLATAPWQKTAAEYHEACGNRVLIVEPPVPERLEQLRRLIADDVSFEDALAELNKPKGVAESTLQAAEYLIQTGNSIELQDFVDRHSPEERAGILEHLEHLPKKRVSR
jgi:hypothetical protein